MFEKKSHDFLLNILFKSKVEPWEKLFAKFGRIQGVKGFEF